MYRLMQLSQTTIPVAANFTHLFGSSRIHNRVEFLTDFPVGDDAEVISSLQVHPQGWCALSRNVSNGEKSEVKTLLFLMRRFKSQTVERVVYRYGDLRRLKERSGISSTSTENTHESKKTLSLIVHTVFCF